MKWSLLCGIVAAFTWQGLWSTPDQYGQRLMNRGEFSAAAEAFQDPMRKGIAWYRAGEFEKAEQQFARTTTAEGEFNRGNSLVLLGKYDAAVARFDRALELRPDWKAAQTNRSIAATRAKLTEEKGGDQGDQRIGADKIVYDRSKKSGGGEDTQDEGGKEISAAEMQAMWLRRVQTKPADFLKAKFAYQSASDALQEPQDDNEE